MVGSDPAGGGGAPDIYELFCHYNALYFRDSLGACAVCWADDPLPHRGMHIGLPKYVPFNLKDIVRGGFKDGDEISLESLKSRGLINPSGRERKLPLKILGDGDVSVKLNIKARAFSASAKEKLEAAGCTLTLLPKRKKWLSESYLKNQARAEEYFAKKKGSSGESDASA
ncbi:hypothetical protein ACP70R_017162 [Stipagrostis hirtigluma subsp. patula]